MCGIIGYKGLKNANLIALDALKSLEYRGYDSWGIVNKTDSLNLFKTIGKIGHVKVENLNLPESNIAIGHNRWATHGGVTQENSHPHLSNDNEVVVVHNGIIENFQELKDFLKEKGFFFRSETDSEVIPNLIQFYLQDGEDLREAFRQAISKLEGSFAVVALFQKFDKLFFARMDSPLVVGVGVDEFFVASDVPAFLTHTNKVVYLDNGEFGFVNDDLEIFKIKTNEPVVKPVKTIDWSVEQAQKGDFPHFMLKEINEQRFSIKQAVKQSPELISKVTDMLNNAYGIFFVGCGTSFHACVSASYQFAEIAKKHVNVTIASEFRNYENFLTDKTLMVAVSQSGETADLLDAVRIAKAHGVKVISIVNVMGSTLTRVSDVNIMMNSGPEICVLSTKSYTSQLAILLLLAYSVAGELQKGKELICRASEFVDDLIIDNIPALKQLAARTKHNHDYFLIGRDLAFPSALEGALKIKEVSYIHAEGFAGAELKHGTMALIDQGTPTIVLSTKKTRSLINSNAAEIKSRGGFMIGIGSENNSVFDFFVNVPDVDHANPLLMIIPIQLLAYYLALEKGCPPDTPRNLAKAVTVR